MSFARTMLAASVAVLTAIPAFANGLMIEDAYLRTSGPTAKSAAAFMTIMNNSDQDDRVVSAASDLAKRVELHTHVDAGNGVMQMREVEGGFPVPAGENHILQRGGDHVMFMGLTRALHHGDVVTVTLTFENTGEVTIEIPVDLER